MANKNLGEVQSIATILMANSLLAELDGSVRRISVENFLDSIVVPSGTDVAVLSAKIDRIRQTLGHYSTRSSITLTASETGVAISSDGVKVTKSGWAIAEFEAEKGVEYLFKPGTTDGNVCIFAQKVTSKEIRSIAYTYTYNDDGTIATASATYNGSTHAYSYAYNEDDGSVIITDADGNAVTALPYQYESTVGTYLPMTRLNAGAELPEDGYCRFMSHFQGSSSLKVVVSYKVGSADLTMQAVKDGVFASIATQLGNLSGDISLTQSALAAEETLGAQLDAAVERLVEGLDAFGDVKCESVSSRDVPMVCGRPMILLGHGVPSASTVPVNWDAEAMGVWTGVPTFTGQHYIDIDATSAGEYYANGTSSVSNWINK
jgi:hypothetical protein